jgi:pyruvate, water dikinase
MRRTPGGGDRSRQHAPGQGFQSPFAAVLPAECVGWEEMYPSYALFGEERRAFEDSRFWFQNALHYAEPCHPFDAIVAIDMAAGISQASARRFAVPTSLGLEIRILGGYVYLSPNSVTDAATIGRRAQAFTARASHHYAHWHELDACWREKVEAEIRALRELEVPELPQLEDESFVLAARGIGSGHDLVAAYDRLLGSLDRICHVHFELLTLGYGAYLALYEHCREAFPGISDRTIATMVSGIDVVVLEPDDALRRLAGRAVELGVAGQVQSAQDEAELRSALGATEPGRRWLVEYAQAKDPWFHFSYGNGFYHHHRSWIDDATLPIAMIGSYVGRLESGEDIERPRAAVLAERDRVTGEWRALLPAQARAVFDEQLQLARTVFPHVENHNFYIEHWYHTLFWNKVRDFGDMLCRHTFLAGVDDVFFLRPDEVRCALEELRLAWSSGGAGVPRGPMLWPAVVERRRTILDALRRWTPPAALGRAPEAVTEPVTIMLWGITTGRIREWLEPPPPAPQETLTGIPASPGIAEGVARVIINVDQLVDLRDGEVLVAPSTSTSWTPVFGKIAAAVTDAGGVMCHAAIVAREYSLPAVLGTGSATRQIATGDLVRVDANRGVVTILRHG